MVRGDNPRLHVAIIMDGNGRWATRRGLPRIAGHRAGVLAARRVIEQAAALEVGHLTLYAFSSDNWRRPEMEVQGLFRLLRIFLRREAEQLRQNGVRLQVIGRRDRLPKSVLKDIERAEAVTASGRRLLLSVAIDYSSRDAITRAAAEAIADRIRPSQQMVRACLMNTLTADGGEVDLLIRTGGEKRLSDFLLWESAYAELVFTDCMWPDFDEAELDSALREFSRRERRFGAVEPLRVPEKITPFPKEVSRA